MAAFLKEHLHILPKKKKKKSVLPLVPGADSQK